MSNAFFLTICKVLAQWSALVVFCAPFPTIQTIIREKSVGSLPLLPYSSMIASTFLWMSYGQLINDSAVTRTNVIGLILAIYYFVKFVKYSPAKSPTLPGSVRQHFNGILAIVIIAMVEIYLQPIKYPVHVIGSMALCLCIAMFGAPLSTLKTVLKTKSAISIPLPFTLATIINCVLWSIVGWFDLKDFNVYFPNFVGLSFGMAQLGLKVYYRPTTKKGDQELNLIL